MPLHLDDRTTIDDLYQLGLREIAWVLDQDAEERVRRSYAHLHELLETGDQAIYGLHTHYGHNVRQLVSHLAWQEHQMGLLDYLHVGIGPCLPETVVRRALRLQAYKMSLGYSGLHPETWSQLRKLCEAGTLPEVPAWGSLGASGDLIPMAHAIAPLFQDEPPRGPRDVISLVNTNSMMASLAIECWHDVWQLYRDAHGIWLLAAHALGWQGFGAQRAGWEARGSMRPFRTSWISAMEKLEHALPREAGEVLPLIQAPLQERYSIRCAPQILLDLGENLQLAARKIEEEALGLADNPVLLEHGVWHGGHFFASGLATAADWMNDALARLGELVDRQVLLLVTPELNHGLPANLAVDTRDHLKGLHQLASALLQKIRAQGVPARQLSFSCESHNQDLVPASMAALQQVRELSDIVKPLLRVGMFVAHRAFAFRRGLPLSPELSLKQWPHYTIDASWQRLSLERPLPAKESALSWNYRDTIPKASQS